ncbi:MAG: alpha/beta hydrolase [Candidatus Thorarchaeota archaeon]
MISIPNDEIISPRLLKLKENLEKATNKKKIIDEFWKEIEEQGTPIIENIEKEPKYKLVTFLYKEDAETDEILLISGSLGVIPHRGIFKRIQGSNIYYKSIFYLNETRTTYAISRQKANIPLYPQNDIILPVLKGDPLNKKNITAFKQTLAVLELPDAPSQPWIEEKDNVPKGILEQLQLKSIKFERELSITIYLPPNYKPSADPYGSLFLLDGSIYNDPNVIPTPVILNNLIFSKKIPPIIAVFIYPHVESHHFELNANPDFAFFVGEELQPFLQTKYNITNKPEITIVGGASIGALSASHIALKYPNKFGKILSQSGAYWYPEKMIQNLNPYFWNWHYLIGEYVKEERLPLDFYLEVGIYESREKLHGQPTHFYSNRHFRDVLLSKGYSVKYVEYTGGHDFICLRGSLADALIYLIGNP